MTLFTYFDGVTVHDAVTLGGRNAIAPGGETSVWRLVKVGVLNIIQTFSLAARQQPCKHKRPVLGGLNKDV